jgi:RNA polymerase sigma factor, sigma-70 family
LSPSSEHSPSDGELFLRLSHGDEAAYRLLIRRHEMAAYHVALLLVRSVHDAEEVVGITLFELWRKRKKVRIVEGSILPWLLTVVSYTAKNHIRGHLRYQRLLRKIPYEDDVPDHADEVAFAIDALEISAEVQQALAELDSNHANVLVLCVVHELSMKDAAVVLGLSEGTVKSRLSRAKAKLRTRLAHLEPRTSGAEA